MGLGWIVPSPTLGLPSRRWVHQSTGARLPLTTFQRVNTLNTNICTDILSVYIQLVIYISRTVIHLNVAL